MKYRKRPVVIDAVQYLGTSASVLDFCTQAECAKMLFKPHENPELRTVTICTLEGAMTCSYGDWIIRGVKGELYPCKPDIFAATYEEVKDGK